MNRVRVLQHDVIRLERDQSSLNRRFQTVKAELERLYGLHGDIPELRPFLVELGHLYSAADPARGASFDSAGRSADPPAEGDSTRWARVGWQKATLRLVEFTYDLQAWMGTPRGERALVDPGGKCVSCGRRKGSRVRVSRNGVEE